MLDKNIIVKFSRSSVVSQVIPSKVKDKLLHFAPNITNKRVGGHFWILYITHGWDSLIYLPGNPWGCQFWIKMGEEKALQQIQPVMQAVLTIVFMADKMVLEESMADKHAIWSLSEAPLGKSQYIFVECESKALFFSNNKYLYLELAQNL